MEDNLQWKTNFVGRQPSVEDNLWWKTTFGEGRPLLEDDLRWKTTFSGRQPLLDPCMWPTLHCVIFLKTGRILPEIDWCHYQSANAAAMTIVQHWIKTDLL